MAVATNSRTKLKKWVFPTVALVVIVVVLIYLRLTASIEIDRAVTWEDYSSLLRNLLLIALLLERFVEVFLGVIRTPEKLEIQSNFETAKTEEEKEYFKKELKRYRNETAIRAMQIAYSFGIIVSLAGVRSLEIMFVTAGLGAFQAFLFRLVDVVLTASLIAGGSNGINQVTAVFSRYLETLKEAATTTK